MSDFNPAISRRAFAQAAAAGVGVAAVSGGWDFLWPESAFADENSPVEERFSYCDMCNHSPKCGITTARCAPRAWRPSSSSTTPSACSTP